MLFSFWSGPVTWLERLSVASANAIGEEITVFTYENCDALSRQLGCRVADAANVFPPDRLTEKSAPHFSDHFRLEGLAQGLGTWTDLDVVFVRPLPPSDYIFGWQNGGRIGNSVLRIPSESELLKRYLAFCRERPLRRYVMPWMPWPTKCTRAIKGLFATAIGVRPPAPKYGPPALTHFAKVTGVDRLALPESVLYPLPIKNRAIARVYEPGYLESRIGQETVCVHLWRSTFSGINGLHYPRAGWLANRANALLSSKAA